MNVRWIVELDAAERKEIEQLTTSGTVGARMMKRALILQMSNEGRKDEEIVEALSTSTSTVYRTRKRYVEGGLEKALNEDQRPGGLRKLSANDEATLVALACSEPPDGRAKWTMSLLADQLLVMTNLDSVSAESVRRRFREKKIKPWQHKMWCIPSVEPFAKSRRISAHGES